MCHVCGVFAALLGVVLRCVGRVCAAWCVACVAVHDALLSLCYSTFLYSLLFCSFERP